MAGLHYKISADNADFKRKLEESRHAILNSGRTAEETSERVSASIQRQTNSVDLLTKSFLALGGAAALTGFARQVFNIRSQFQDIESSMTVFLGSAEKAQKHVQELLDYAYYNMFEFKDLTVASSQLLAFGNDVESVIPIIDKLSNIAAGTKQPLGELVDLYNKAKSMGVVQAQHLQSWARQGIVITDVLKEMGVEVDRSSIKFEHLEMVLDKVTSEGGRFHNLMESQMQNLSASWGQLQDNLQVMFNEIGKKTQDTMKGAIDFAGVLVDNYEKIGRVILGLVGTYGAYRAAIIAVNAAKALNVNLTYMSALAGKNLTIAQGIGAIATMTWQRAMSLLNKTMMANPFVFVTTLVFGLATAIWALRDRTDAATKAQERHNEAMKAAKERRDGIISNGNQLISTIESETATIYEQIEAWELLKDSLPQGVSYQDFLNMNPNERRRMLKDETDRRALEDEAKLYEKLIQLQERYLNPSTNNRKLIKETKDLLELTGVKGFENFRDEVNFKLQALDTEKQKRAEIAEQARFQALSDEDKKKELQAQIDLLEEQKREIEKLIPESKSFKDEWEAVNPFVQDLITRFNSLNQEIVGINNTINAINTGGGLSFGTAFSEAEKAWRDAEKAFEDALKNKNNYTVDEFNRLKTARDEAKKKFEDLSGNTSKKEIKQVKDNSEQIARLILDAERALNNARLSEMQDGRAKRIEQNRLEFEETIRQIEEQRAALARLRKLTPQEEQVFQERTDIAVRTFGTDGTGGTRREELDRDYERQYADMLKRMTDALLHEEDRRKQAITERFEHERSEAQKMFERGEITETQRDEVVNKANDAEQKEQLNRILENVTDFKRQEADIRERFDKLIADEAVAGNEELIALLTAQREKALSEIQMSMLQENEAWKGLFDNLETLTASSIDNLIADIEKLLEKKRENLTEQQLKQINAELARARAISAELQGQNPFKGFIKSTEEYIQKLRELREAKAKGLNTVELQKEVAALAKKIEEDLGKANQIVGALGSAFASIAGDLGNDALAQKAQALTQIGTGALSAGSGIAKLAGGDIVGGITDLAKGIADVVKGISGMSDAKRQKNIEALQKNIDALDDKVQNLRKSYQELGRQAEQAFAAQKAGIIDQQNKNLEAERKALEKQQAEIRKQIEQEKGKKNGDTSQFDSQLQANQQRMEEIQRQMEENAQAARNAIVGTDIKSAINEFANAYVNAWQRGEKAAEASANVAKNILKNALAEAMKQDLAKDIEKLHAQIANAMQDGSISDAEQRIIDDMVAALAARAEKWENEIRPYLDDLDSTRKGVTGELQQAMTEGTASQLVGLWNMTAMDIRDIRNYLLGGLVLGTNDSTVSFSPAELYAMMQTWREISANTRETADNTERIISETRNVANEVRDLSNEMRMANVGRM